MPPASLNCSSANLMSLGSFQLLMYSLAEGAMLVMLGRMAQLSVLCQSESLDFTWIATLWCVAMFTLLIQCMAECVWVFVNLKRCTRLSVMKWN
jgi:hypothetical protein